ncbi:hypothetical protein SUGI_0836420 [Cryptomeria japonica]|uniref:polygalacturonase At1g48100 n=1 Tax=Cryptomeria japonica TaxID=3369 RepID=UPI00241494AB|nr:polygalacturonase At1g48100 [Cryptomeria japonica]GLJ40543.1 hypothetical protein SUGI_0836420 [Cryptomeria japonica]
MPSKAHCIVLLLLLVFLHEAAGLKTAKKKPAPPAKKPGYGKTPVKGNGDSAIFDVLSYGAKGDGVTDDTKAFMAAWQAACSVESAQIVIPSEFRFLVGPITFSGPCQPNIIFQIEGTIIAPTNARIWGSGLLQWMQFIKLKGITIQGCGVIDGQGSVWWDVSDGSYELSSRKTKSARMPSIKPTALRFYGSFDVTVQGITIQNSAQCHLKLDSCTSAKIFNVTISSPCESPNTDGIHLQNSEDIEIHHSTMACGDDCVSIQTGCADIRVHNINCGPGHGISIGGLGKDQTKACVSNITVYDSYISDALNGVRIKTWQGGVGSVKGVSFSNIEVSNVRVPIVIDQFYCDKRLCRNQTAAVAIAGVKYEKIRGTYVTKAAHLACSDNVPCTDVTLTGIELEPVAKILQQPFCWKTYGETETPTIPPIYCLHSGNPFKNGRVQSHRDSC